MSVPLFHLYTYKSVGNARDLTYDKNPESLFMLTKGKLNFPALVYVSLTKD